MDKQDIRYKNYIQILKEEKTIETVGKLARHGMKATDEEIIRLMLMLED